MGWCSYHKSYTSHGSCPNLHYKYTQVATILCLLLNVSSLLLLSILAADGVPSHQADPEDHTLVVLISSATLVSVPLQVFLLLLTLVHLLAPASPSSLFHLSVGVLEKSTGTMTLYGSTATSPGSIDRADISVCYQRVSPRRATLPPAFEPLALPRDGLLLPGHGLASALSVLLLLLHSLLLKDQRHLASVVVVGIVTAQSLLSLALSLLTATDTGFCCLGVSVTRWFLHTDFYTQAVEFAVSRQFSPAVRQPLVAEWFRSSLPSPPPGEEEMLDRAGQLRLLQHLLETTHASLARTA